ncbi:MAG: AbrB family transcriptional regulator [Streptosporangiales bacterium]|nr:AbrB family transcriptional regulator [Streptosporangiales bacterium]
MSHSDRYSAELGDRGRLVLPAAVRRRLKLAKGDRLLISFERDGSLRVESARAQAERLRGLLRDIEPDRRLSEELIAERRAEARDENHRR